MASGEVVSSVFFTRDKLLWMEKLTVRSGTYLVDNGRLEINEDSSRDMLSSASLAEERVERIVCYTNRSITAKEHAIRFISQTSTKMVIKIGLGCAQTPI